jgi:hypothetical protein
MQIFKPDHQAKSRINRVFVVLRGPATKPLTTYEAREQGGKYRHASSNEQTSAPVLSSAWAAAEPGGAPLIEPQLKKSCK